MNVDASPRHTLRTATKAAGFRSPIGPAQPRSDGLPSARALATSAHGRSLPGHRCLQDRLSERFGAQVRDLLVLRMGITQKSPAHGVPVAADPFGRD